MTTLEDHQQILKNAIIELLCLTAVFKLQLKVDEIHRYLKVTTTIVPLKKALESLVSNKKVIHRGEYYGLPRIKYPNPADQALLQRQLLLKAKRAAKVIGLLPFVKSVVVVNSAAIGNVHSGSDIDLFIIVKPARIYVAKGALMYGLKLMRQLETAQIKAARFSLGMFVTIGGVNWRRDIMCSPEPYLPYWLIMAKPVYGADVYYTILRRQTKLEEIFPNFPWPKSITPVYSAGFTPLDWLDNLGYKKHLAHTAAQPKNQSKKAFIRIRPDIINLHAQDRTTAIAQEFNQLRKLHLK